MLLKNLHHEPIVVWNKAGKHFVIQPGCTVETPEEFRQKCLARGAQPAGGSHFVDPQPTKVRSRDEKEG